MVPSMTYEEAVQRLAECDRHTLIDYAFGDEEITWDKDGKRVASGYLGRTAYEVTFSEGVVFTGVEAIRLALVKPKSETYARNDSGSCDYDSDFLSSTW